MSETEQTTQSSDRRDFFRNAGAGVTMAGAAVALAGVASARPLTKNEKLDRIMSNTWPVRSLFKRRASGREPRPEDVAMKKKYGEITMLDFPRFTTEIFPGVHRMDLWSGLFGDVTDDSMFESQEFTYRGRSRKFFEFDPATPSAKKWLDKLVSNMEAAGITCHHVSNNAPRNISDLDPEKRKAGLAVAKKWLDASARLGAKTMRVNTGGPRVAPCASATSGYPRNDELVKYLNTAIDSYREMADYGGKLGVKVTIENHWGLSAHPMNVRIILDELNHPYCEASPDFCNWEHEYMLYHGLEALAPYTHTTVHAKYWDRWKNNDVQRSVRILNAAKFKGVLALEYEHGPWDGVEGARYLLKEVLAAL